MSKIKPVKHYSKEELAQRKVLQTKKIILTVSIIGVLLLAWIVYAVWDDSTHSPKSTEATEIVTKPIDRYLGELVGN